MAPTARLTNRLLLLSARMMHFCLMYRCLISSSCRQKRFPLPRKPRNGETNNIVVGGESRWFFSFFSPPETRRLCVERTARLNIQDSVNRSARGIFALISYRRQIFVTPLWKMETDYSRSARISCRARGKRARFSTKKTLSGVPAVCRVSDENKRAVFSDRRQLYRANVAIILFP